jgi:hypothetical protein
MGRLMNVLVVGAVAAVVAAAAVDALRGRESPEAPSVPASVRGELVYSDLQCSRHALRLPDLARRDFRTVGCGVFTRYDNLGVKEGDVAWFAFPVPGGTTTLVTRSVLRFELGSRFRFGAVAWLRGTRFAAVVEGDDRRLLTIWDRGQLRTVVRELEGRHDLRASPSGRYFAALGDERLLVYDREGKQLGLPDGRAIAWSPRERLAAVAGNGQILIVPAGGGETVARIPVDAVDVDWRSAPAR